MKIETPLFVRAMWLAQVLTWVAMLGLASYGMRVYLNNGLLVRVFYGNGQPVLPDATTPTPSPTPSQHPPKVKHG